jgi:hypothetical protein
MGEEKWMRRKPGRVSGTVVPPPVGDDAPSLPQRARGLGRSRHRPDESGHARAQPPPPPPPPPPELPDNVRPLFQPVLQPRDGGSGREESREPSLRPARSPQAADVRAGSARQARAAAVREWPPGQPDRSALPGSALAQDWQPSEGWPYDRAVARDGTSGAAVGTLLAPSPPRQGPVTDQQGGPVGGRTGASGRRHIAWLATLTVLLLLTAAGTTVALLGQHSPAAKPSGGGSGSPLAGAATARADAARWVSRQVSTSSIVGCDAVMCGLLVKQGVPSSDLMLIRQSTQDPLGAAVIVATPDLQSQFGLRLSTEYAPAVLASFGSGGARVDVRVIAPEGADAYQLALRRDIADRELQGTQLVGNKQLALPASAQTELAAGQVDPRLLITLPTLAQQHPVKVLAFYNRAPGASPGVPLTGVKLAGSDLKAGLSAHAYLRWLVTFLHSQRSLYRAANVHTAWHQGRAVVYIKFALPNPIGLLN